MSEVNSGIDTSENYDAQQKVEEIAVGEREASSPNVEADYEASKQFSVSAIDRTEEGATAAEAATAPQFDIPEPDTTLTADATGNPDDYKKLAGNLSSTTSTAGNVSDDLVKKALEKGSAGE